MGCNYSIPQHHATAAAHHSYTSLDTPNSTSTHKQQLLASRNSNFAAEALVYIHRSAFFSSLTAVEKAKLAFICERATLNSNQCCCLIVGDLVAHCGDSMLVGGESRSLAGELSLVGKSSPVGASATPPIIPNPTIANLIYTSSTPNSHSPSPSSLFLRQGSNSSLNRRKLFATEGNDSVVQDGALDINFRCTSAVDNGALFKLDCNRMHQTLDYKTLELLTTRARWRDPKYLAKHTLLGALFMEYPKDLSAVCQLFEFRALADLYAKPLNTAVVVLVVEGIVDAYISTVLVGSFGPGDLLHEHRLFCKGSKEQNVHYVVRGQSGLALCLDAGQLQVEILPKLSPTLRTRFDDEELIRDTQAFKQYFSPWFAYMSDASVRQVIELSVTVVLQDGEQLERTNDGLILIKSGEVTVSHSLTRKSSSGTFIWAREDDLCKQSGELVLTKPAMDLLFEANPCSTTATNNSSLGVVAEDDDDDCEFEIRASCNDTRVLCLPAALVKLILAREAQFAADFELRLLKDQCKFDTMLVHPVFQFYFCEYLQSVQAIENLEFWLAAKTFALQQEDKDLVLQAEALFSEYVAANSDKQVNLSCHMRQGLEHSIANKMVARDLFQGAALECFSLMQGCLIRFHKSDLSARMFQAISTGMSLEDCRNPPPLPTTAAAMHHLRENSPPRRSTVRRLTSSDGTSSALLRIRRHSSSQTTTTSSPRPSFNKEDVNAVLNTTRRTSALLTTPRSSPMKSPLSGLTDVKLDGSE